MLGWLRRKLRQRAVDKVGPWKRRWARCSCNRCHPRPIRACPVVRCPCGVLLVYRPWPEAICRWPTVDFSDLNALLQQCKDAATPTAHQHIDRDDP